MADIEIAQLTDRLMRRIHGSLNASAEGFDKHRIGPAGGILLLTLADHEPARVLEIVKQVSRDKSQITRGIQALERKGLIQRNEVEQDGRGSVLSLTEEGKHTVVILQEAIAKALDEILLPLSDTDRESLKNLLQKL